MTVLQYLIVPNASNTMTVFAINLSALFICLDCCTYTLAVYFVFDFGYDAYLKLCGSCDKRMRRCCQKRYTLIVNGDVYMRQFGPNA